MAALTAIAAELKFRGVSVCFRVLSALREKKQKRHEAKRKLALMSGSIRRVK